MLYAFSRDNAVPGSSLWKKVHPYFEAPINAVWLCVFLCFVLFLPSLGNTVAFAAITSVGVIGLYISYAIPIGLRVFYQGDDFKTGPFNLGRWSRPIGIVAFAYLLFACAIFVCPYVYPVTAQNLNYAPVTVGAVLVFCFGYWLIDARRWFVGPLSNLDPDMEQKTVKTVE
jgi:amino acid transporter